MWIGVKCPSQFQVSSGNGLARLPRLQCLDSDNSTWPATTTPHHPSRRPQNTALLPPLRCCELNSCRFLSPVALAVFQLPFRVPIRRPSQLASSCHRSRSLSASSRDARMPSTSTSRRLYIVPPPLLSLDVGRDPSPPSAKPPAALDIPTSESWPSSSTCEIGFT